MSATTTTNFTGLENRDFRRRHCTLNSLLQLHYRLPFFRQAIFTAADKINSNEKTEDEKESKGEELILLFDKAFKQMMEAEQPKKKEEEGDSSSSQQQQAVDVASLFLSLLPINNYDYGELKALLIERLGSASKVGREILDPAFKLIFQGVQSVNIASLDGEYKSQKYDDFYQVHLASIRSCKTLEEAFAKKIESELLVDDNKIQCDMPDGSRVMKDAKKFEALNRCPAVLTCDLKRFEMDFTDPNLRIKKVDSALSFPETLCLSEVAERDDERFDACILGPELVAKSKIEAQRYNYPEIVEKEKERVTFLMKQQDFFSDEETSRSVFIFENKKDSKESEKQPRYSLFAVVEHEGDGVSEGYHRVAVKCVEDGRWRSFSDASVQTFENVEEYIGSNKAKTQCIELVYIRDGTEKKVIGK